MTRFTQIFLVSEFDAEDRVTRSGVPFHLLSALRSLGIPVTAYRVSDGRNYYEKLKSRIVQYFYRYGWMGKKGWYDAMFAASYSRGFGRSLGFLANQTDTLVISISPRTVANLPEGPKLALWIDNTFDTYAMYPGREGICQQTFMEARGVESRAFNRAEKVYTASGWLAARLPGTHGLDFSKIAILPRGANLLKWPGSGEVEQAIEKKAGEGTCRLLFVNSGNWNVGRKGGSIVVDCWRLLKSELPVELIIVGDMPGFLKNELSSEGAVCLGKLSRKEEQDEVHYIDLLMKAHFMFVPSKADGFGIVYAEAAACGLPSIAKSVMGVSEAVKEGITGHLLPGEATPADFAKLISSLWKDKESYRVLCDSAHEYARLNFSWVNNIRRIVEEMDN